MGESVIHMMLVERMAEWVANELFAGNAAVILLDVPSRRTTGRPPAIDGHVPDLYVDEKTSRLLVIGEAKSARDLETERSERQIGAFLEYCSLHENALFVLAVPWHKVRFARCLLRMLQRNLRTPSVSIKVLDRRPG